MKNDKFKAYLNAYKQALKHYDNDRECKEYMKKTIYSAIKVMTMKPDPTEYKDIETDFRIYSIIKDWIGKLTPNEFIVMYPVTKEYDGKKYGIKDYIYTMEYIDQLERDEQINKQVDPLQFLTEYTNKDIHQLNVNMMMTLSKLSRLRGEETPAEAFARMNDIDTVQLHTDNKGNEFFIDDKGKTRKAVRENTKRTHLRLVK